METNRLDRSRGETSYQFVHDKKIKKLFVDDTMVDQLSRGRLAIVFVNDAYEVVAEGVAARSWSGTKVPWWCCMTARVTIRGMMTLMPDMRSPTI